MKACKNYGKLVYYPSYNIVDKYCVEQGILLAEYYYEGRPNEPQYIIIKNLDSCVAVHTNFYSLDEGLAWKELSKKIKADREKGVTVNGWENIEWNMKD